MSTALARGAPRIALTTLGLALVISTARPVAAQDVMTAVSAKHIEAVLTGMGFDFTQKNDHTWKFELADKNVLLFLENDNTDAQLYIGFGDTKVSPSKMNEWNKSHRFTRAYADDDSNPVLESDLDFTGGVTDETIKAWIKLYGTQVKAYVKFLSD
jgi:hypothetical protein